MDIYFGSAASTISIGGIAEAELAGLIDRISDLGSSVIQSALSVSRTGSEPNIYSLGFTVVTSGSASDITNAVSLIASLVSS